MIQTFEDIIQSPEFIAYCAQAVQSESSYTIKQIEKTLTPFGMNRYEILRDNEVIAIFVDDVYSDGTLLNIAQKSGLEIDVPSRMANKFIHLLPTGKDGRYESHLSPEAQQLLDFLTKQA